MWFPALRLLRFTWESFDNKKDKNDVGDDGGGGNKDSIAYVYGDNDSGSAGSNGSRDVMKETVR